MRHGSPTTLTARFSAVNSPIRLANNAAMPSIRALSLSARLTDIFVELYPAAEAALAHVGAHLRVELRKQPSDAGSFHHSVRQ